MSVHASVRAYACTRVCIIHHFVLFIFIDILKARKHTGKLGVLDGNLLINLIYYYVRLFQFNTLVPQLFKIHMSGGPDQLYHPVFFMHLAAPHLAEYLSMRQNRKPSSLFIKFWYTCQHWF